MARSRISKIEYRISNIKYQISNIEYRISHWRVTCRIALICHPCCLSLNHQRESLQCYIFPFKQSRRSSQTNHSASSSIDSLSPPVDSTSRSTPDPPTSQQSSFAIEDTDNLPNLLLIEAWKARKPPELHVSDQTSERPYDHCFISFVRWFLARSGFRGPLKACTSGFWK